MRLLPLRAMESFDAAPGPRFLLRLENEELVDGLVAWAHQRNAHVFVRGSGSFAASVLADAEGDERKIGAAEAIQISGWVNPEHATLRVTLLRGMQPIGGSLVRATVIAADLEATVLQAREGDDDAAFEASSAPPTSSSGGEQRARPAWASAMSTESSDAGFPSNTVTTGAPSWADVAAVSQQAPPKSLARPTPNRKRKPAPTEPLFQPDPLPSSRSRPKDLDYLEEPVPSPGDYVQHKQFGKCRIERVGDDGELLLKMPGGRRKHIKLTVLKVLEPTPDKSGHLVFPLVPRKRR